jgi:hypothetical protein
MRSSRRLHDVAAGLGGGMPVVAENPNGNGNRQGRERA